MADRLPAAAEERARLATAEIAESRLRRTDAKLGIVLLYHRLDVESGDAAREIDPALAVAGLERHLRYVCSHYDVVPTEKVLDAVARRQAGEIFPLAITFDDQPASHVRHALPLLEQLSLPATFFLCGDEPHWWYDLQRAVDCALITPDAIPGLGSKLIRAALDGAPGALREVFKEIMGLPPPRRDEVALRLRAAVDDQAAMLTEADIRRIAASGSSVGFHTLRHYDLRMLDDEDLEAAMSEGRAELTELAGRPLSLIAYPYGLSDDRVADAARRAGFELGFTIAPSAIRPDQDPLKLGRLQPPESIGRFARHLVGALREAVHA